MSGAPFTSLFGDDDDDDESMLDLLAQAEAQQRTSSRPAMTPAPARSSASIQTAIAPTAVASPMSGGDRSHQSPALPRPPPARAGPLFPQATPAPPAAAASNSASTSATLVYVDIPSLVPLFVRYFSSDYPCGVPTDVDGLEDLKRRPQWIVAATLSRFFHTFRDIYVEESDVRLLSRVILPYTAFCVHVSKFLPGMESEMDKHPADVLACLQCALHHACAFPGPPMAPLPDATADGHMPIPFALPKLIVRFRGFRPVTPLKHAVKAACLARFVCVQGTVVRTAPTRPAVTQMEFVCTRCRRRKTAAFIDNVYAPPESCDAPCNHRHLEPDRLTAQCVDHQIIKVQEILHNANYATPPPQNIISSTHGESFADAERSAQAAAAAALSLEDQGRVPRTLEVLLVGADLVDTCIPGDVVSVCGVVKARKQEMGARGRNASVFVLYLEANALTKASQAGEEAEAERASEYAAKMKREGELGEDVAATLLKLPSRSSESAADFSTAELNAIHHLAEASQNHGISLLKMIVASICPTIYGHEAVKAGLLLALLGGVNKNAPTAAASDASSQGGRGATGSAGSSDAGAATSVRGDIHVLLVGDPGLGKSQMLRATSKASPRGVYISGGVTSKTGLTVTMVRDGKDGDFALEAGALVLADQGCCCIDEFDKMTAEHNALLEAMEQQSISIAKAGMVCSLAARTSVIAAANPVGGHYNRAKTVSENLKIGTPLLSRFDLVFIILDQPDMEKDQMLSEHVIKIHGRNHSARSPSHGSGSSVASNASLFPTDPAAASQRPLTARLIVRPRDADVMWRTNERGDAEVDLLPIPLVRKYIAYARKYCKPLLSQGARSVLSSFYLSLRRTHADSTPITTRQLEALIRLAEARAKAELREVVTAAHAEDVVHLLRESMVDVDEGGGLGSDGSSSRAANPRGGMSKAAIKKKFVLLLRRKSEVRMDTVFTAAELYALHEDAQMRSHVDDFAAFIDSLNTEGYLLKVGPKRYKLVTVSS